LAGWPEHGSLPDMTTSPNPYRGFRFPAEIIEQAVWLYHCFSLSLRDVELILAARGVVGRGGQLRNHPRLGYPLRPSVRQHAEAAATTAGRQMVHGRGVHPHPRHAALSLARGGSGWKRARHPRAEPAQRQSGQAVLPKAAERSALCSARDRDGQTAELRRCKA